MEKRQFLSTNDTETTRHPYVKKLQLILPTLYKNELKLDRVSRVKHKTIKFLKEKVSLRLCHPERAPHLV